MKNVLRTRMRPLEPSKNKALVTVAGSLQEKHARGAYGEAVPKTTTNHRYVKSIVDTKVAFGDTLAKPSNSNLTAAHSSKLLGALPLGKGSADFRRNHLRYSRLGLTRVLLFLSIFWYGSMFPYPVVTVEPMYFKIYQLIEDHIFRDMILEENPVTARRLQHLGWRPRAKNPTQILVREKKSAPLACLWLSNTFHDACSDCCLFLFFSVQISQERQYGLVI